MSFPSDQPFVAAVSDMLLGQKETLAITDVQVFSVVLSQVSFKRILLLQTLRRCRRKRASVPEGTSSSDRS